MHDSLLLRALRSDPVPRPPVWLMRQAGRYLPEYHEVRAAAGSFLDLCRSPEHAARVTLQPLRRFPLDAAIVFNDILVPPAAMGMDLAFVPGRGPRFSDPLRSPADLRRLRAVSIERDMPHVLDTIRMVLPELEVPLLGFSGAPFTLAAYMVEGGASRDFLHLKGMMLHDPGALRELLDTLAELTGAYLQAQVEAGCSAVQVFDTWAGCLAPEDFRRFALPAAARALEKVRGAPRIYFTRNASPFLPWLHQVGAQALAVDWRTDLGRARRHLHGRALMGNLDPAVLFGPEQVLRRRVRDTILAAGPRGHVFNLGHGLLPGTPIEAVAALVDEVRSWRWEGFTPPGGG